MDEPPSLGGSDAAEAHYGYEQLGRIGAALGGSWIDITSDPELLAAVYDWTMVRYPRAAQFLSHSALGIQSILTLGNASPYQQQCLSDLDTCDAVGVFASTEIAHGTNVLDLGTVAVWHREGRYLSVHTPDEGSVKLMPNLADPRVQKHVVVLARLVVDGVDEGVFPILVCLRGRDGLAAGVEVGTLPTSRHSAPLDHAAFYFDDLRVPADALLGGDWAYFDDSGSFVCELDRRGARFKRSASALSVGRVSCAGGAAAAARAGWVLALRYARQRDIDGVALADRDEAQRKLVSAAARLTATTALVNYARAQFAVSAPDPATEALVMAIKPLASDTAYQVLTDVGTLCGAQAALGDNMFGDWLACIAGIWIAEGANDALRCAVGRQPQLVASGRAAVHMDLSRVQILDTAQHLSKWHTLLQTRERVVVDAVRAGAGIGSTSIGPDSTAIDTYKVISERLAADAMVAAAARLRDPASRAVAEELAAVYILERIDADAAWFLAHGGLTASDDLRSELAARYTGLVPHLDTIADAFDVPALPATIDSDYQRRRIAALGWQGRW
ncbi:acyl-CoA dehydrogenase family protein [Nocardia sp. XZ_19_369]|uniref:acyl-CoA dehydrogenase family protein n=1 Tax=Nocardia sp. XZ_19_369 TaxID=2769487 RepID=UPI0018909A5E|nr:acyl-CoA dehydrogenase family protein [Nocardia sp. XZ_19_369]